MNQYRTPFLDPVSREVLYRFPNEAPIAGESADEYSRVEAYQEWLLASGLPKLCFRSHSGVVITADVARWCTEHLRNSLSMDLGRGLYYLQEDNPHLIGGEITAWLPSLGIGIS